MVLRRTGPEHALLPLDSLPWIVGAKTSRDLGGDPVHHGADEASGYLELAPRGGDVEIILRRVVDSDGRTRLFAEQADGKTMGADLVEALIGRYMFSPVDLADKLRPQDQVAAFLEVCNVKPPVDQVAAIVGEPVPATEGESADQYFLRLAADASSKQRGGIYYNARLEAGRVVEQKKQAKKEVDDRLAALGGPLSQGEADLSMASCSEQMETLQLQQRLRNEALALVTQSENEVRLSQRALEALQHEQAGIEKEIQDLNQRLAERHQALALVASQVTARLSERRELNDQLLHDQQAAAVVTDPLPAIRDLSAQMKNIQATNDALAKRRLLWQEACRVSSEADQAEARHDQLDQVLEGIRELWRHLLDDVQSDFPGLSVDNGKLCFQSVPLGGCARNEQIWVGALIATGQKPRPPLPILRIDEGERIGPELEARLQKLCWDRGYQFVYSRRLDVKYIPAADGLYQEVPLTALETEIIVEAK